MSSTKISGGVVHKLPSDMHQALRAGGVIPIWESLTPLARNEWICWTITVKQSATRKSHIKRTVSQLKEGKRRPCCWIGCVHRTDKPISRSVQWVLDRQAKSR